MNLKKKEKTVAKKKAFRKKKRKNQVWPEAIRKGIALDRGVLIIVLYAFIQGIHSLKLALSQMMVLHMNPQTANITLGIFLLSMGSLLGSIGLYNLRKWGKQLILAVYTMVMPLMTFIICIHGSTDVGFVLMRIVDVIVAGAIIFYLSRTPVKEKFEQATT